MLTTQEVAEKLVEYCKAGDDKKAYEELYSPDVVSIEMGGEPQFEKCEGMEAVEKKYAWWEETFEVHGMETSDPLVGDAHFAVRFWMDVTHKESGGRSAMAEIAVYEVEDGKIVKETFYYAT